MKAVGRSAGRAVASICAIMSATPSVRLSAQGTAVATLPGSTRSAGLGGAGVALVGDAGAIFANPAGIATVRHIAVEASYEPYFAGTALSSAALALRLPRFDLGFGLQALDYGSEAIVVPDSSTGGRTGIPTGGSFHPVDLLGVSSIVLRYGLIAVGGSAKYTRQEIGGWSADAWAGDVGGTIALFDIFALGVSVQNLGGNFGNGATLGKRTRAGFTMNYVDPEGSARLLTTVEGQWSGGHGVLVAGLEGGVVRNGVGLIGRVGLNAHGPGNDASPLSFGAGLEFGRLHLDYAYQSYDALAGGLHRVGLRWTP